MQQRNNHLSMGRPFNGSLLAAPGIQLVSDEEGIFEWEKQGGTVAYLVEGTRTILYLGRNKV